MVSVIHDPFKDANFSVKCDGCGCCVSFTLDDVTVEVHSGSESTWTSYTIPCPGLWCNKRQKEPTISLKPDFITKLRSTSVASKQQTTRDTNYDL